MEFCYSIGQILSDPDTLFSAIITVSTFIYMIVTIFLWWTTKQTAQIAQKTLKQMQNDEINRIKPVIDLIGRDIKIDKTETIVEIENIGNGPAFCIEFSAQFYPPSGWNQNDLIYQQINDRIKEINQHFKAYNHWLLPAGKTCTIKIPTLVDHIELPSTHENMFYFAKYLISYNDSLGNKYLTEIDGKKKSFMQQN